MSRGEADEALRLLDEAMALLELVEKSVGELAEAASSGERVSPGSVYSTYTSLVRLRDKLAELRGVLYSLASRGCGAGTPLKYREERFCSTAVYSWKPVPAAVLRRARAAPSPPRPGETA